MSSPKILAAFCTSTDKPDASREHSDLHNSTPPGFDDTKRAHNLRRGHALPPPPPFIYPLSSVPPPCSTHIPGTWNFDKGNHQGGSNGQSFMRQGPRSKQVAT